MTNPPLQYPEIYDSEDVQQILQIALARKGEEDELTRQQLWEIAAELDIDPKTIQAAEQDWLERKAIDRNRQAFNSFKRDRFNQKLAKYLIINGFIWVIHLLTPAHLGWFLPVALFWGLSIVFEAWNTFQTKGEKYEREFQKWMFRYEVNKTIKSFWMRVQKALTI